MFLGNFLIGSLHPVQQIGLVQAKNLKKLQIFCKKERLDKFAEAYLIEHSEGLESVLEYSLKNYGAFQNENNDLFFKCHRANKELLLLFLEVAPPNFDYMTEMLCMVDVYPQVGEFFKRNFQKLSEEDKAKFINQLKPDKSLFCVFWRFFPIEITEVELFEAFLEYYQNQVYFLNKYVRMHSLPQEFQNVLEQKQLWTLIKTYAKKHQDFCFSNPDDYCAFCRTGLQLKFSVTVSAEAKIFEDEALLLGLAAQNGIFNNKNKIRFIKLYERYPAEVEQYIVQYGKGVEFSEEEFLLLVQQHKNWVKYISIDIPLLYMDYILSEKRKKSIPYAEEDLPVLIRLSWDNPLSLKQFIVEHGKVSPQLEAELFFRADEKCREKYVELYGVNLLTLVKNAAQYGATENELKELNSIDLEKLFLNSPLLSEWKIFQKHDLGVCVLAKKIYGTCAGNCYYCEPLKKIVTIILPMLLSIAHRNYLRG